MDKRRGGFFFLFSPLRLRRNNFSCAIMRLTIEREKEDSDNAFSRFVFDRVIDIVAFGTKKRYTSIKYIKNAAMLFTKQKSIALIFGL